MDCELPKEIDTSQREYRDMFSKRPRTFSLGILALGMLTVCTVRAGFGQDLTNGNPNPTTASYANGEKTKIRGTVVSVSNCQLTMRDQCGVESVVLIGEDTSIKVNGHHHHYDLSFICPGSCVKVEGRGNCSGQLVAEEIKSKSESCEACAPACQPACPTACAPPEPVCPAPCNPCASSH